MGGKHKQAQRIKNNARPSSSGRSAELLASSSSQFSTTKEIRFIPPTLSLLKADDFDSNVSPDFQLVFKKMNKKDSTTKLKAFQEFADLIEKTDSDTIKTILAFWASLYNILATDTDHRVREGVHNAHLQIVLKDKKLMAPFLKQLIGPWFAAQYDNYPPAASAASKSFNAAFPPNKIQDCVVYGQKEILTYIYDNITSKIDQKAANNDEAEAKYERVIISSLQGYSLYFHTLTSEQIEKSDLNIKILSNQKFLKLATSKSVMIRAAWFKLIATIYYQKLQFLLTPLHSHLVPLVFANLDESEPAVVSSLWEALVLIMNMGDDWWKFISIEKQYLNKLKKVLREGGHGSAVAIYPNLLTLLHHLPPDMNFDAFYDSFFDAIRCGLRRKSVSASKSESIAVVTAFVECLQYVMLNNKANRVLCEKLIVIYLIELIEWSLREPQISYRVVFNQVASLVQYLSRNEALFGYSKLFWSRMGDLLERGDDGNEEFFERQVTFLQYLKNVAKPKEKVHKVKFAADEDRVEVKGKDGALGNVTSGSYADDLKRLVYVALKTMIKCVEKQRKVEVFQHIFAIVQLFESREFLVGLSDGLSGGDGGLYGVYEGLLYEMMNSSDLSSETCVNLCFVLYKYLNDEEKIKVLQSLVEFCEKDCFCWIIKNVFSHPYNSDKLVRNWIQLDKISDFLLQVARKNLQVDCPPEYKMIFKLAFMDLEEGDLLMTKETVCQIINTFEPVFANPSDYLWTIDTCAHLASFVSAIIYTETYLLNYGTELLITLFKFSLNDYTEMETLTTDTLWEVTTSWQDALTILANNLPKPAFIELIRQFSKIIENHFLSIYLNKSMVNRLIDIVVNLLRSVFNGKPFMVNEVFNVLFETNFYKVWREDIIELCTKTEYLNGNLAVPSGKFGRNIEDIESETIVKYFIWKYVMANTISSSIEKNDECFESDEEDAIDEIKPIFSMIDSNQQIWLQLLYDIALAHTYADNYKTTKYLNNVMDSYDILLDKAKCLNENLKAYESIENNLLNNIKISEEEGWIWCKALKIYSTDIKLQPLSDVFTKYHKDCGPLGKLYLTQVLNENLSLDYVRLGGNMFEDCFVLRQLIQCEEIDVQIAEVFNKIKLFRNENVPRFLFDTHYLNGAESCEQVIEIVRFFTAIVAHKFEFLNRINWDIIVISFTSWTTNCLKLKTNYANEQFEAFIISLCDFFIALNGKMKYFQSNDIKNSYIEEWNDLFLPSIQSDLAQLWLYLAEQFAAKKAIPLRYQVFIRRFGEITSEFNYKLFFNNAEMNLPNWTKIVKRCLGLLTHTDAVLQLCGYQMLMVLVPGLIEIDLESANLPNRKGLCFQQFRDVLLETQNIVNDILVAFKLGEDSCLVEPYTDSYTYVYGYILLWCVLLNLCDKSPPELRYQYAEIIKNDNSLKSLLSNLFKLMSAEILHNNEVKTTSCARMYQTSPAFSFSEPVTSALLEHLSCWLYSFTLAQLPALVRQWWTESDSKITQIIEGVTANYVSPQLCQQELFNVANQETKFKNMTIKTIQSVREVIAVYTVDEAQMELVITLPANYPLGGPDVRCNRQIGGAQHKQWLMQLKKCLLHQNGRIWDGLLLWNANLDKKFDGVEECYICFAVLHPGTYQLPKLSCQTCRKKFHSACLYKWFSTSNKSSCPICRNLF